MSRQIQRHEVRKIGQEIQGLNEELKHMISHHQEMVDDSCVKLVVQKMYNLIKAYDEVVNQD